MSRYFERIAAGLCGYCGKPSNVNICDNCKEDRRVAKRRQYQSRVERGLCVECNQPSSSLPRCTSCVARLNRTRKGKQEARPIDRCRYSSCQRKAANNRKYCPEHLAMACNWAKVRRGNRQKAGLCGCGRQLDSDKHVECQFCRDSASISHKQSAAAVKDLVLKHYSNGKPQCACCGESIYDFLAIDHINGGGNAHRKAVTKGHGSTEFYRWLIKNNLPEGYQVLCHNCNYGKWRNNGVCPHKSNGRSP